jgi:sarcosine oxidase subunit alpha
VICVKSTFNSQRRISITFGLHTFKEELTGPEYADRFIQQVNERKIPYLLSTMVMDISRDRVVTAMNRDDGMFQIQAKAVVLAMGCREKPRGALNIPGYRPAGIFSAGTAQRLVNIEGYMPGKEVVILGSGDIGLIMARRMTLEGAKVRAVVELMPYSSGLKRNIVQCLDDYGIPLMLSHTVVDIKGKDKLEGVYVAAVDSTNTPIKGTEEYFPCDTLLLSCGLIPENELTRAAGIEINPLTNGPSVDESLETSTEGVFACGNVLHVHDLVDFVSEEALRAGENAAAYIKGKPANPGTPVAVKPGNGVRYTVPSRLYAQSVEGNVHIRFRVTGVFKSAAIVVRCGEQEIFRKRGRIFVPSEMQDVIIPAEKLRDVSGDIEVFVEGGAAQ